MGGGSAKFDRGAGRRIEEGAMAMFKTILTAVDFSDMSREVLHYAVRLAAASPGARLLVANVVPDPLHEPWMVEAVGVDFDKLQADWIAQARWQLANLLEDERLGPEAAESVVVVGRPADAIVALAKERSADVLVIGTHGYGPVKHIVLGSVAERVLRQAACPVVTVPHKSVAMLTRQREEEVVARPA
jgi:nucleotide-binding universal stress UspA family protein